MSRFAILGLLVLACIVLVVLVVAFGLEGVARKGIERVATAHAKVPVTLQRVQLSLLAGRASLERIAVSNPPTYQAPTAVTVESVTAKIDWGTLTSDRLVISDVVIVRPEISFEGSLSENNLETIRKNFAGAAKATASSTSPSPSSAKTVIIQRLRIVDARVNVRLRTGTIETTLKGLRLNDLTLEHLGDPEHPLSTADVTARVFGALTQETVRSIGKGSGGVLGQGAEALSSGAQEAGKKVERAVDGLKQLFSK